MENISIREWVDNFCGDAFEDPSIKTQIKAGWYDWFCKDSSLVKKTEKLGSIVAKIVILAPHKKIDIDKNYVWFKNNCPLNGPLYDDFRFADLETGEVQFTIQVDCCWNKHKYTVYGRRNNFETPLFECDNSSQLVKWFGTEW